MADTSMLDRIRALIAKDQLAEALNEMPVFRNSHDNIVIAIKARLSRLDRSEQLGTISFQEANIERNRIREGLLSLISDMIEESIGIVEQDQPVFEKIIGRNGLQRVDWLRNGLEKARCVCKIHISGGGSGTGFLVEGQHVFTNHHVLPSADKAALSQVEFGYDDPEIPSVLYDLDVDDFVTSRPEILDFTRVKVKDQTEKPIQQWGALSINSHIPRPDDVLTIIQHPQGRRQEIAFSDSGNSTWEHRVHYKVSTEPGSSGSPVFDIGWNVIAIHHAGGNLPVNARGEQRLVNEGILFSYILQEIGDR